MRTHLVSLLSIIFVAAELVVQSAGGAMAQPQNGNRANGLNYQPTPNEVAPREKAAGVQTPVGREKANNEALENIDKKALRDEGQSTQSVPKLQTGQ